MTAAAATPIAVTIASCKHRVRGLTKPQVRSQASYVFLLERYHVSTRQVGIGLHMTFPVIYFFIHCGAIF